MAIGCKSNGKFGTWLWKKIHDSGKSVQEIANDLYTTRQNVYLHLTEKNGIQFSTVTMYCWYFEENPIEIWKMIQ